MPVEPPIDTGMATRPAPKTTLPRLVQFQVGLAVVATLLTVGLSLYIPTLLQRRAGLEHDITSLTQQKEALEKQTTELTDQRDALKSVYRKTVASYAQVNPAQAQADVNNAVNSNPTVAAILPRIFIHIRQASQREDANQIASKLQQDGFIVPGIQIVVREGPTETQVRYFHDTDKDEAQKIANDLVASGVKDAKAVETGGYPNIRPRQYEIWFSPNAFAPN